MAPAEEENRTQILMIDDDAKLCRLVRDYLKPLGYDVTTIYNGLAGLEFAQEHEFAAIILDVMMPGMDGLEVLRRLRAESSVPILMLTGRGEVPDRIVGLELGADDYLAKTFSTRELVARLRSLIRRSWMAKRVTAPVVDTIVVDNLVINRESRSVELSGVPIVLTAAEFEILISLAQSVGRVKTREQLLIEVADRNFDVFDRSIDVHVSSLRKKLGDDPKHPRFISTVRSVGYMMRKPGMEASS